MEVKIVDNKLVISLPLIRKSSKSGKTILVATTNGLSKTDLVVDDKPVTVGVNAFIPRD